MGQARRMTGTVAAFAAVLLAGYAGAANAQAPDRIEAGLLTCDGEGGWGLILGSRKKMRCTFTSISGKPLGFYFATVTKFGLDIGKTGETRVVWAVFAPASRAGANYEVGSLDGTYVGVTAEATAGVGLGANALVGGGAQSFALQPVSVQTQTGLNIAAGVGSLRLEFDGPIPE
jgi:hypothetical protein